MAAPAIFHFHPVTGELSGSGTADSSPMEPGVWLFPANCTRQPPPSVPAGKAAIWSGTAWSLVPDNRGQQWYLGHDLPVIVSELGDPSELGLSLTNPPAPPAAPSPEVEPPATVEAALSAKFALLDIKRRQVEEGGIFFEGMPIKTDRQTAGFITAAYLKADRNPDFSIANWKFSDGIFGSLNADTIIAVGDAVSAHIQSAFNREAELSAEILALNTAQAINEYDVDANW